MQPTLTHSRAEEFFDEIVETKQTAERGAMILAAIEYARIRVDDLLADPAKRATMGANRGQVHNTFIAACNLLAEKMEASGESPTWRQRLGEDRKDIGDFACYIHYRLGLEAR